MGAITRLTFVAERPSLGRWDGDSHHRPVQAIRACTTSGTDVGDAFRYDARWRRWQPRQRPTAYSAFDSCRPHGPMSTTRLDG